jgi:hypothetical protein
VTITLRLEPQEEAKIVALAQARGVSTEAFVREALDRVLSEATTTRGNGSTATAMGDALVTTMQASPYKEMNLEPVRNPLPVRDVLF